MNLSTNYCNIRKAICLSIVILEFKLYYNVLFAFTNHPIWKSRILQSNSPLLNKGYNNGAAWKTIPLFYKTSGDTISANNDIYPKTSLIYEQKELNGNEAKEKKCDKQLQLKKSRSNLPFGLIVNHNDIKHALLLLAANPRIGGIAISGRRGKGKFSS